MLFMARGVPRDEAVSHSHDLRDRTVVLLQKQHAGALMVAGEAHQCVGIGRAEAVYALILVADHEEIPVGACKHADDLMLYL